MFPGDRCVLKSKSVAQANEEVLKNDNMHIQCFERTGMMMTLDDKFQPQGLTVPVVVRQGADLMTDGDDNII